MPCCEADKEKGKLEITKDEDRSCTDLLCCLLFLIFWAAVLFLMAYAINQGGSPLRAVYGRDFNGLTCGVDTAVANMPLTAWPNPVLLPLMTVCVSSCNTTMTGNDPRFQTLSYQSSQYLKFCLPNALTSNFTSNAAYTSISAVASRAVGDLVNGYSVIAIGAAVAFVAAILYLKIIQCAGAALVWFSLILVAVGGAVVAAACLYQSNNSTVTGGDPNKVYALKGVGITVAIITFLYFCAIVFMRDRIRLAVKITEEAANSLQDMKSAIFFPIIPFIIVIGYFIWWIYTAALLFSVTTNTVTPYPTSLLTLSTLQSLNWPAYNTTTGSGYGYYTQSFNTQLMDALAIHFFHLLWNVQFWIYFTFLVISGAVAQWYFTPFAADGTKPRGDGAGELPESLISSSLWRAIRYHLGSVCFASLIIAIVQFIRGVVLYFEQKAKDSNMNETLRNCLFCCVNCCLKCVECCLNQINRNGFVFVAVYGTPFCSSSCNAFAIAFANLGRVAWVSMCGDFLMGIGKVFIAVVATAVCGAILFTSTYSSTGSTPISSPAFLLVVIFILTWCIASIFMVVYETVVDTIFMCFLIDESENSKTGKYLASKSLQEMISEGDKENKDKPATEMSAPTVATGDVPVAK